MAQTNYYYYSQGTGTIIGGKCVLNGIICGNTHNSPVYIYDWTSNSGKVMTIENPDLGYTYLGDIEIKNALYYLGGSSVALQHDITFLVKLND